MTVSWTAVPGSGITYTVWYSTNSGTTAEPPSGALNVSGITGTSATLSGLAEGTTYYIWVLAVSSGVPGPYSMRMSETTYSGNVTIIGPLLLGSMFFKMIGIFIILCISVYFTPIRTYYITPTPHTVYTP